MSARPGVAQRSHSATTIYWRDPAWRDLAACRDSDPDLFTEPALYEMGVLVCRECPVKKKCGEERHGAEGVWAGNIYAGRKR